MKKVIISLILISNTAHADVTAYAQFMGSILLGGAIATVIRGYDAPKPAGTIQIIPVGSSTPFGKTCELRSVMVNDQIVTNNYCY